MDAPELLRRAARQVPTAARGEAGTTMADAHEYLEHDE
jgi:hypothetical protein